MAERYGVVRPSAHPQVENRHPGRRYSLKITLTRRQVVERGVVLSHFGGVKDLKIHLRRPCILLDGSGCSAPFSGGIVQMPSTGKSLPVPIQIYRTIS